MVGKIFPTVCDSCVLLIDSIDVCIHFQPKTEFYSVQQEEQIHQPANEYLNVH